VAVLEASKLGITTGRALNEAVKTLKALGRKGETVSLFVLLIIGLLFISIFIIFCWARVYKT
jgi:hypothetical protein